MTGEFRVITIDNHQPIEGKDRIVSSFTHGELIVISKESNPIGTRGLLFDCESEISPWLLEELSLYRDNNLNKNKDATGYFFDNRVKPQTFAGCKCTGFFLSFEQLKSVDKLSGIESLDNGYSDNSFNGIELCKKYIPPVRGHQNPTKQKIAKKKRSVIVDGQFTFHKKTGHLGDVYQHIHPDTLISITHKLHGTSFISSRVLCKGWDWRSFLTFGLYRPKVYRNIYSSRQVIKNLRNSGNHFYKADVWGWANDQIKDKIEDGISIYGEITGYVPETSSFIQKGYDYGSKVGEARYWVYRITHTDKFGNTRDFSTREIQEYCRERDLNVVPTLFIGRAADFFSSQEHYSRNFFEHLDSLIEDNCSMCQNKVPAEGFVVRFEDHPNMWSAYKLKSFAFRMRESKATEADIETTN